MKHHIHRGIVTVAFMTVVTVIMGGCATQSAKIGTPLESSNTKVKFSLDSPGTILVAQKVGPKADCDSLKRRISVSMSKQGNGTNVPTTVSCDFLKGNLVVTSKTLQPKGDYSIGIRRTDVKGFKENPVIYAKYEDPDFSGGADSLVDGAKELVTGQSIKGAVSYPAGNSTEWVRLKGKNASVGLTLVWGPEAKDVKAEVYDATAKTPKLMTVLANKKKRMVPLRNSNVLVKITAKAYGGTGQYSLIRADAGALGTTSVARGFAIPVIDCYQVGDNNSVVLLQAVTGVKVNDEVSVFGRKTSGENVTIGSCQVTSIVGSQASCKMDRDVTGFVEYHAEGRISG